MNYKAGDRDLEKKSQQYVSGSVLGHVVSMFRRLDWSDCLYQMKTRANCNDTVNKYFSIYCGIYLKIVTSTPLRFNEYYGKKCPENITLILTVESFW